MSGAPWTLPPLAKVYEAFSAVADGRVHLGPAGRAEVESSGRDRRYEVEWSEDFAVVGANDNASYWQGYLGYPAVAALLAAGALQADDTVVAPLAGVPWHELNRRFRRDYAAAVEHVLADLERRGIRREPIVAATEAVMAQLAALAPLRGPRRRPPAASRD